MEKLKKYLSERRNEIFKADEICPSHAYHNEGHIEIIDCVEKMIADGDSAGKISQTMDILVEASEKILNSEDKRYDALTPEEKAGYEFSKEYFIEDGRMCQCLELDAFIHLSGSKAL